MTENSHIIAGRVVHDAPHDKIVQHVAVRLNMSVDEVERVLDTYMEESGRAARERRISREMDQQAKKDG